MKSGIRHVAIIPANLILISRRIYCFNSDLRAKKSLR